MNKLQKIIFVVLVVGVFFIFLNIDIRPKRNQFKLCNPTEVNKVAVKNNDADYSIVKNSRDSSWEIEYKDEKTRADYDTVKAFLTLVCYLPYRDSFSLTSDPGSPRIEDYGIKDSALTLTVFGKKTVTQYFGDQTPTDAEYYYTNSREENKIYTIPNLFYKNLNIKPFDFKNRALFSDLGNAEKIVLSFAQFQLEFKNENGSWQESQKQMTPKEADGLVGLLNSFRFRQYHGPLTEQKLAYYGMDYPDVLIEISRLGREGSEKYPLASASGRYYLSVTMSQETYLPVLYGTPPREFLESLKNLAHKLPSP